jgi:RNA polymerase sigma-70 factor (ECF subfamily)
MGEPPVSDLASTDADQTLIRQAQAGDPHAFDALVRKHQQLVFAVALRMLGDHEDAKDVAQDAFVRAYDGLRGFRGQAKFSTWLVAITVNLARNRRRWWARQRRVVAGSLDEPVRPEAGAPGHDAPDPAPGPSAAAEQRERHAYLLAALQQMPMEDRTVIVLRDVNGHSYEEIAEILGCALGTVKSRLSRARMQLRAMLNGKLG